MKAIYLKIKGLLQEVTSLKEIDLDYGQLETDKPAVKFPCALINIAYPKTEDLTGKTQRVSCVVSIRLGFNIANENTSSMFSDEKTNAALSYFDTVNDVYKKLQGYFDDDIEELSRTKMLQEKRNDALKVTLMPFETEFDDLSAE